MTTPTRRDDSFHGVRTNPAWRWLYYGVMLVLAVSFLFPLVYMLASSFKPDDEVLTGSQSLTAFFPTPWVGLENYVDAIDRALPGARGETRAHLLRLRAEASEGSRAR